MQEANPIVIIIAGANGAGKSTIAPFLLRDRFGVMNYVNADTIANGLSAFAPETFALEAGRIMLKQLREMAQRRTDLPLKARWQVVPTPSGFASCASKDTIFICSFCGCKVPKLRFSASKSVCEWAVTTSLKMSFADAMQRV